MVICRCGLVAFLAVACTASACTGGHITRPRSATPPSPAAKVGASFSPIPVPKSTFTGPPLGTISGDLRGGPWSSSDFLIINGWRDVRDGVLYRVFAGSVGGRPRQGIVIVIRGPANDPTGTGRYHIRYVRTPHADGAVKMTSETNWIITLKAADGAIYKFNVLRARYVG